ncbi:MAG TPA: type II toxin-antitoxin system HicA family toxin [Aestuariivirga sp.]
MNSRHRKTLEAVFTEPTKSNIAWVDIEALLINVGCSVKEGAGSRVRFVSGPLTLAVHRPHPRKEAKQHHVRAACDFLKSIGVTP